MNGHDDMAGARLFPAEALASTSSDKSPKHFKLRTTSDGVPSEAITEIYRRLATAMGYDEPELHASDLELAADFLASDELRNAGITLDRLRAEVFGDQRQATELLLERSEQRASRRLAPAPVACGRVTGRHLPVCGVVRRRRDLSMGHAREGKRRKKNKKSSDMPRRALSAYNIFFSEQREVILKEIEAKEKGEDAVKKEEEDDAKEAAVWMINKAARKLLIFCFI